MDTANEARSDEQLERAVDRRPRDLDALLFHFEQELVGVEVIVRGEDLAYERGAFVGDLQPLSGEEILKAVDFALNDRHVDGYLRLSLSCSRTLYRPPLFPSNNDWGRSFPCDFSTGCSKERCVPQAGDRDRSRFCFRAQPVSP